MSIKTVGFACLSPDALRVIFRQRYRVSIYTGDALPNITASDTPNIVIVPNMDKRYDLEDLSNGIHRMLLHARGRHQELLALGVPILDAVVQGAKIDQLETRTADQYRADIEAKAVDLNLSRPSKTSSPRVTTKVSTAAHTTLDSYFDTLDNLVTTETTVDFSRDIEQPVAQFIVGEITSHEFQGAMKAVVTKGLPVDAIKEFYSWVRQYKPLVHKAITTLIHRPNAKAAKLAQKFGVDEVDLELIMTVYHAIGTTKDE